MTETIPGQPAASQDEPSAPERVDRDQLMAGVVLARAIVAVPATGADWKVVSDFHAAVVQPLLYGHGMPDAEREQALSWARALGGWPR